MKILVLMNMKKFMFFLEDFREKMGDLQLKMRSFEQKIYEKNLLKRLQTINNKFNPILDLYLDKNNKNDSIEALMKDLHRFVDKV